MFRHPKYYKELRKRNKSDQAISSPDTREVVDSVRSGPGLRSYPLSGNGGKLDSLQTLADKAQAPSPKHQASSAKQQASSESKPEPSSGSQASSDKPLSHKHRGQASSHKQQAP